MVSDNSVHSDLTVHCGNELDDGEHCNRTVDADSRGRYINHPRGEDRHGNRLEDRFEQSALRLTCPDCGANTWVCPMCADDTAGPGYFGAGGEAQPCPNCNQAEVQRRRRHKGY